MTPACRCGDLLLLLSLLFFIVGFMVVIFVVLLFDVLLLSDGLFFCGGLHNIMHYAHTRPGATVRLGITR